MDSSSFEGFVLDPSKCSKLSMEEKRELVYEVSKWSNGAPELLLSWSRQEILQILCAEIGKERKYTGLTKLKIIENLLKVVSEKNLHDHSAAIDLEPLPSSTTGQRNAKRQRKSEHPNRLLVSENNMSLGIFNDDLGNTAYCKNSACRAKLSRENQFCKRCSCCICYKFDDNKDPSLWLTCSSEPPYEGESCGMSCHLECALRQEKSGIVKDGQDRGLDGSFYCVSCGKVNDLLGCWRKQMMTARDTRRVDILCYRVSLSQKLLTGTKKFQKLYKIVDEAMRKLEVDVGTLSGLPVKMARGIVNRLSSGPEVQRLCSSAVESLDLMLSGTGLHMSSNPMVKDSTVLAPHVRFEGVSSSSLTVCLSSEDSSMRKVLGYTLWHRRADEMDYPAEPTCSLIAPNTRFPLSGLTPATVYYFKVAYSDHNSKLKMCEVQIQTCSACDGVRKPQGLEVERSQSPATNSSSLSNPSSLEDENNNVVSCRNENEKKDNYAASFKTTANIKSIDLSKDELDCIGTAKRGTHGDLVSMLDEKYALVNNNILPISGAVNLENQHSPEGQAIEESSPENGSNTIVQSRMECVPFVRSAEAGVPITPYKLENFRDGLGKSIRPKLNKDLDTGSGKEEANQDGSSMKKRSGKRQSEECVENGDRDFGYYVKVIRWLECDGHIETSFRQKFLTWYSLRATPRETKVVKVYVDTFIEDPSSLAGQLVDTFSEVISNKRSSAVPMGFCLKLWH